MKKIFYQSIFSLLILTTIACEDNLEITPSSHLGSGIAIKNEDALRAAVNGVYNTMSSSKYYDGDYITAADMLGDDVVSPYFASGHLDTYFDYSWTKIACPTAFYKEVYASIAHINDVMIRATELEDSDKKKALFAELKALRAIEHFDIARLYGPAPVNLGKGAIKKEALCVPIMEKGKDPKDINGMLRKSVEAVYSFIIKELETALSNLPKGKKQGTLGYDGAQAALARIYLYKGDFQRAYSYAKALIDNSSYSLIKKENYINSWTEEYTSEGIFELSITTEDNNNINSMGYYSYANGSKGYKEITASKHFEKLMEADKNDVRFEIFVHYKDNKGEGYLPSKKFPGRDGDVFVNNLKVFRLSEIYLIASEAKLHLGQKAEAAKLLNALRKERTSTEPNKYTATSITIEDILYERRLELFAEGHRAWDLWRNQKAVVRWQSSQEKRDFLYLEDDSQGTIAFDDFKAILPIHEKQLLLLPEDQRDTQQNPGY